MDITRLEKLICEASARMTLAQKRILPTLDSCIPGLVGPMERERFKIHHRAVIMAYNDAVLASSSLLEAAKMIGTFIEQSDLPRARVLNGCKHERLNEDGICRQCGADCRGGSNV